MPKQIESGHMSRFGHITRRGPALLRSMLVEAAWVVWRHNAWAHAFVQKISRGSKARRHIAIVALARKLLMSLWVMLRDNTPWLDPLCTHPFRIESLLLQEQRVSTPSHHRKIRYLRRMRQGAL